MSGQRIDDRQLRALVENFGVVPDEDADLDLSAIRDLADARATLATTQAALEDAEEARKEYVRRLTNASDQLLKGIADNEERSKVDHEVIMAAIEQKLAAEAALKDARAEIAAAERRGMERAAQIARNVNRDAWAARNDAIVAAIRAALPSTSDAAPAASGVGVCKGKDCELDVMSGKPCVWCGWHAEVRS